MYYFRFLLIFAAFGLSYSTPTEADCEDAQYHIDPDNCPEGYYRCTPDGQGGWLIEEQVCAPGTAFNPDLQQCEWIGDWINDVCDGLTHAPTDPTEPTIPTEPPTPIPDGAKKVVCYYSSWAFYRPGYGKFDIDDIDPFLCTHLNYGFANMNNMTWEIVAYDPWFDLAPNDEGCDAAHCHHDTYRRFNALKQKNPNLKTFLSIGGWNSGSEQWSMMASEPERRKIFIDSVMKFVSIFGWDGIDFDWEYPGDREGADPEHDKENFSIFSKELGAALHAQGKLFTAAMSQDYKRAGIAYDMAALTQAYDWFNIMDYDYHGGWENFTGHNTPLFGRHEEDADGHPGHRYNLNDSISYYIDAGVPREMIVVGMATFGHSWTLLDPSVNGLYCPTIGGTPPGPYTRQEGFLEYYEILQAFNNDTLPWLPGATPKGWTTVIDGCYMAPYSFNGPYWVGYDNVESMRIKGQWVNSMELGGSMVWSIEADDFRGDYGPKYPLVSELKRIMNTGEKLDPDLMLGEGDQCDTAHSCWGESFF